MRVTTNLVQVDAVVTDKDGKQVDDLRPEDFEIIEDNFFERNCYNPPSRSTSAKGACRIARRPSVRLARTS